MRPLPNDPVPVEIARAAFPKGNLYFRLRDELGTLYNDQQFAPLFSATGQPALPPWRLALVTVFQFLEGLTDRQAADQVRARLDWKYALGLALDDPGFDFSVLSEFRSRLIAGHAAALLLDTLLDHFKARGLLRLRRRQRTDSTHVLGAIRRLNRLELVAETFRAALNELATVDLVWLTPHLQVDWVEWYAHRLEEHRLPKGEAARDALAVQVGQDGAVLLRALETQEAAHLQSLPKVRVLRLMWTQQFEDEGDGTLRWKAYSSVPPASQRPASPYDPEAHFASKRSLTWDGYKVYLTETCDDDLPELVTNVLVTAAPQQDLLAAQEVHQQLDERDLLPEQHLMDAGYVSAGCGKLLPSKKQRGLGKAGGLKIRPPAPATGSLATS